jgi:hypothetical protein
MNSTDQAESAAAAGDAYRVVALGPETWEVFAELVERNGGVYGGCWCIAFHFVGKVRGVDHRTDKERRVRSGQAHAALVLDSAGVAQGWAQYGSPDEVPGIKHRIQYAKEPPPLPDWRITCVFTDRRHRHSGVARAAVTGAVQLIAAAGGGLVEAISETTEGRVAHDRFLFSATAELFEDLGFERGRQVGKHAWVLSREVAPL